MGEAVEAVARRAYKRNVVWPEENAAQPKAVARHAYTGGDVCGNREAGEAEAEAVDVAPTTKSRLVSSARCSRLMRQQ